MFFSLTRSRLRIWPREAGSAVSSRVSLLLSILKLNLVLTYGIPPEFRGGVYLFIKIAIRHRVSPEFIGPRNCVPMAFTAESSTGTGPIDLKVVPLTTGAALAVHYGPIKMRVS